MLEDEIEGRLYKTVWLNEGKASFSVSRVNQQLSYCFVGFWSIVTVYVGWRSLGAARQAWATVAWPYGLGILTIAILISGLWLYSQQSDLPGTVPKVDGTHGCRSWRKNAAQQSFIRRSAPGEEKSA
jgi:hypothetical protein